MELQSVLEDATAYISEIGLTDGFQGCGVQNMGIMQTRSAKHSSCSIVEPLIGLVLQGGKDVRYGTEHVKYRPGDIIVIGQALPMLSGTVNASLSEPYIALYVGIDMQLLRSVYSDMGVASVDEVGPALETEQAGAEIIGAISRMFNLRHDAVEERALGSSALREVYFRVLRSKGGAALLRVIQADSKANQVAKAIAHIRKEYRNTIKASDLAAISGMSASVFYDAFKNVTANSPLQFQKDLRLTEAHQLLQQRAAPISKIAHSVGYESPAQFSREFSRKFGASPKSVQRTSAG